MRRNYPEPIGKYLKDFFNSPNIAYKIAVGELPHTWKDVVGEIIAAQTRQVRFSNGNLYVHVTSSVIRAELMAQRHSLIASINKKVGFTIITNVVVQ